MSIVSSQPGGPFKWDLHLPLAHLFPHEVDTLHLLWLRILQKKCIGLICILHMDVPVLLLLLSLLPYTMAQIWCNETGTETLIIIAEADTLYLELWVTLNQLCTFVIPTTWIHSGSMIYLLQIWQRRWAVISVISLYFIYVWYDMIWLYFSKLERDLLFLTLNKFLNSIATLRWILPKLKEIWKYIHKNKTKYILSFQTSFFPLKKLWIIWFNVF